MDNTSLIMTVEGLRAVAAVCSEIITNTAKNTNNTNDNNTINTPSTSNTSNMNNNENVNSTNDRSALLIAADIEQSCLQVLGITTNETSSSASSTKDNTTSNKNTLASLMSFRGNALGSLLTNKDMASNNENDPNNNNTTAAAIQRSNSLIQRSNTAVTNNTVSSSNDAIIPSSTQSTNVTNPSLLSSSSILNDYTLSQGITNAHLTPITDIIVLHEDDPMPTGFMKIARSITGIYPADLNAASGARQLWLAVARFPTAPAITGLLLVSVDQGEFIPPGFTPVKRYATGRAADLHYGSANGPQLVLCFTRSMGSPIIDIGIAFPAGAIALTALLAKGKGNTNIINIDNNITTTLHTNSRTVLGGTAANIAIAQEEARKSTGVFGNLGQITSEIGRVVAKLGPPREDIPPTYSILKHTLLGADVNLSGGSAKGNAVLVYVKDLTHIDALEDYSGAPLGTCNINVIQTNSTTNKEEANNNIHTNTKEENETIPTSTNLPTSPEGKYNNTTAASTSGSTTTNFTSGPVRLLSSIPASSISTDIAVQAVQNRLDLITNNSSSNPLIPLIIARQRSAITALQKAKEEEKLKKNTRRTSLSLVRETSDGNDSIASTGTTDNKDNSNPSATTDDNNDPNKDTKNNTNGSKMLGKFTGAVGKLFNRNKNDNKDNNKDTNNKDPMNTSSSGDIDGVNTTLNDSSSSAIVTTNSTNDENNTSVVPSTPVANGPGGFLSPNGRIFGFGRTRSFLKEKSGTGLSLNNSNTNNVLPLMNNSSTTNESTTTDIPSLPSGSLRLGLDTKTTSSNIHDGKTNVSNEYTGTILDNNNSTKHLRIRSGTDIVESEELDQLDQFNTNDMSNNNTTLNNIRERMHRSLSGGEENINSNIDEDPNVDMSSETPNHKDKDNNTVNNDDDDDDQEYGISDNDEEIIEHEENDNEKTQNDQPITTRRHHKHKNSQHYHHRTTSVSNAMLDEYGSDTEINPNANHSSSVPHLHHHHHHHQSPPSLASTHTRTSSTNTASQSNTNVPQPSSSPTQGLHLAITHRSSTNSGTGTPTNASSRPDTPSNNDLASSAFTSLSARSRARSSSSVIGGNIRESGSGRGSIVAVPPRVASKHLLHDADDIPKSKNSTTNSKFISVSSSNNTTNNSNNLTNANKETGAFTSSHTMEHGHEALPMRGTDNVNNNKFEQGQDSARRFVLFRHMAWMQSPAASRMCIESARAASKTIDGNGTDELNPMINSNSNTDALSSFLIPSAVSTLITPLLRALYCRLPEIVATALDALALIVETGFFMRPINNSVTHLSPDSDLDPLQEAGLITAAGWNLLDTVVACAVDATLPLLEYVSEPLMGFLHAVVICSSGGYLSSQINNSTLIPSSANMSSNTTTNKLSSTNTLFTNKTPIVPVGLHPATLHRILNAALSAHTFAHQKCVYSERGWQYCMRAGKERDAEGFETRYRDGRRQAACILYALKSTIYSLMYSLEFDGRTNVDISVPSAILTWAYPNGLPKNLIKNNTNGTNNGFKVTLSGFWNSNNTPNPPVSNSSLFGGKREIANGSSDNYYGIRRSYASDYSYLSRAYSAHSTGSASLCSEMHVAAAPHVIHRPFPSLAEELSSLVICPYDALSVPNRSTTNDIVVLITLLSKIALEPVSLGDLRSSIDSYSANGGNTAKRLSALLLRDTALILLQDIFTGAGPVFAASPLLTGCITRFVCPTLLSHALSPRIFHPCLSISFGAGGAFGNNYVVGSGSGGSMDACEAWFAAMGNEIGNLISTTFTYVHCGPLDDKYSKMFDNMLKNNNNNNNTNTILDDENTNSLGLAVVPSLSALRAILRIVGAMWISKGSDDEVMGSATVAGPNSNDDDSNTNGFNANMVTSASIREACAREITALSRAILLSTLACPTAPPFLRLDALDELVTWVTAPQLLMELYINHDMYPSAACPYPHMRFLRSSIAAIVTLACSRRRPLNPAAILQASANDPLSLLLSEQDIIETFAEGQEPPRPDSLPPNATTAERAYALNAYSRSELSKQAATFFASIVRALMDSAATVQMSSNNTNTSSHNTKSSNDSVIIHNTDDEEKDSRVAWHPTSPTHPSLLRNSGNNNNNTKNGFSFSSGLTIVPPTPGHKKNGSSGGFSFDTPLKTKSTLSSVSENTNNVTNNGSSVRAMHDAQRAAEITLYSAMSIAQEKGVKKGLAPLLAAGYIHQSGSGIAHFLRLCGQEYALDSEIGDYLGDEGRSPEDIILMKNIRTELFGGISFAGMAFDIALRIMLTKAGFRLPGEAQKIDRITQAFAYAYFDDNRPNDTLLNDGNSNTTTENTTNNTTKDTNTKESTKGPTIHSVATPDGRLYPASPDVVEILSFSAIMLNTDAHNANIKKEKKMTRKQFVSNNRGIDKGADLPKAFLEYLYDSIVSNEIKMRTNTPTATTTTNPPNNANANSNTNSGNNANNTNNNTDTITYSHGPLVPEVFAKMTGALPSVGTLPSTANVLTTLMINNTNNNVTSVLTNLTQNNNGVQLTISDGELDTLTDTIFYAGTLSVEASRWGHHLSACAKADDRRGAVERPMSPNAANTTQAAPIFFPVPYKRTFSITTVTCAVEDIWPHVMAFATTLLKLQTVPVTSISNSTTVCTEENTTNKDTNYTSGKGTNTTVPPPSVPATTTGSTSSGFKNLMGGLGLNKKASFLTRTTTTSTNNSSNSTTSTPNPSTNTKDVASTTGTSSTNTVSTSNSSTGNGAMSPNVIPAHGLLIAKLNTANSNDIDRRLAALDTLKYATSAALFLGRSKLVIEGANALLQVEGALLGIEKALFNRDCKNSMDSWYAAIMELTKKSVPNDPTNTSFITDPGEVAMAISLLHIAVAEMREAATAAAEAATLQNTAARFKGDLSKLLVGNVGDILNNNGNTNLANNNTNGTMNNTNISGNTHTGSSHSLLGGTNSSLSNPSASLSANLINPTSRRLLYEGEMTKVASGGKGKHTVYRFFLFTDMLVYAQRGAFSDKYAAHQAIPLTKMRVEPDPPELVTGYSGSQGLPHNVSFRLDTVIKPLYLYCATETEATDWKRNIREAVASLHRAIEAGELATSQHQTLSSNTIGRAADAGAAFLAAAAAAIAQGKDPATMAAQAVVTSNVNNNIASSSSLTKSLATLSGNNSVASSPTKSAIVPEKQTVVPPIVPALSTSNSIATTTTTANTTGESTSSSVTTATIPTPPSVYDSLPELKQAFLQAVAFCRPLLSTESGTPGMGNIPIGSRVDLGITSPSSTLTLHDNDKLQFYGLFKQATTGDCPIPTNNDDITMMINSTSTTPNAASTTNKVMDPTMIAIARAKRDAWLSYKGLRRRDAMRKFVELLDNKVPEWNTTTSSSTTSTT